MDCLLTETGGAIDQNKLQSGRKIQLLIRDSLVLVSPLIAQ